MPAPASRIPISTLANLDERRARLGAGLDNPLRRFAGQPFAFVMNKDTASAGEMIAVALLGEGDRAHSFGWPSYGLTTANRLIHLPDNAVLALTSARYGIADEPVIRGKIQPQVMAREDETMDVVLARAAAWAAENSSLCRSPLYQSSSGKARGNAK